ncbi:acyltransferase [uncultured Jatrophihabitans sp.]|uniref:acyltransferase n=1 Tax=uncultured Jatrophihabitans sp. TaxID=1610747 RepID=UPI0035CAE255
MPEGPPLDRAAAKLWLQKWRWYHRARRPWNIAALHVELARRQAFARGALHGNVLQMLREGRLEIGPHAYFEPGVWLTSDAGRIAIGGGSLLNLNVMVAAVDAVTIGEHCMLANGCLITDGDHRFDDLDTPVPWQGFTSKGPVTIGDNVWLGANVVVTSGVTIGERAVIGANSVVTSDIAAFAIAAGAPARVRKSVRPD